MPEQCRILFCKEELAAVSGRSKETPKMITSERALEAALAAGGVVAVDSSVEIELTAPQRITRPTRLIGGSFRVSAQAAFRITSSQVEITGTTIVGPGVSGTRDPEQKFLYAQGSADQRLTGITIHGNTLFGSCSDNIWLEWCADTRVQDNIINNYLYSGVMIISGDGVDITGNTIENAPLSEGVVNTYGIALTDLDNTVAARTRNSTVTGNRVHLVDWEGIDTHGGDRITVTGNTVTACSRGVALVVGNPSRSTAPTNCVVSDNYVNGEGARGSLREGIILVGTPNFLADGTITGNHIAGAYPRPIQVDHVDRKRTHIGQNSIASTP